MNNYTNNTNYATNGVYTNNAAYANNVAYANYSTGMNATYPAYQTYPANTINQSKPVTSAGTKLTVRNKISPIAAAAGFFGMFLNFGKNCPMLGDVTIKDLCENFSKLEKHTSTAGVTGIFKVLMIVILANVIIHAVDTFKKVSVLKILGDIATVLLLLVTSNMYKVGTLLFGEKPHYGIGWFLIVASVIISVVSIVVGAKKDETNNNAENY